jgi:FkbM family methyltransferase
MKSYATHGEDLVAQKHLGSVEFFVDIGAGDGIAGSNTFYFAIRGASGVCFEPLKESYAKLRSLYLFSRRVICRNCGISDEAREADIVDLQDCSYIPETEDAAHTRLLPFERHAQPTRRIRLLPFLEAMRGITLPSVIDLLDIDVEGHELSVLRSIPFDRYAFRLIILETHLLEETGERVWKHRDFDEMNGLLAQHGYRAICRTRANTFYSRDTDQSPPSENLGQ